MSQLNPDFCSVDEVVVPGDINSLTGWTDGKTDEADAIDQEKRAFGELEADFPVAFRAKAPRAPMPAMLEKWNEFQKSKGRHEGSNDLSLLDEFVFGKSLLFLPQIIGSCVMSNTLRPWVARFIWQIALLGDAQEYLGRDEFGPKSISLYGPMNYGLARRRANMRGSDGLYCAPMAESLMKDGVLPCSTPKLLDLHKRLGFTDDQDLPEPQGRDGSALYRAFGDWKHLDELSAYLDFPLLESESVKSAEQLWDLLQEGKPTFVCSMEAIHKVGQHRDGFAIHARNPRDRWAHNMSSNGVFVASDGERFFRWCNQSWGENHNYNRAFDEVDRSFREGRLTMQSIGGILAPSSAPPQVA